jgi:hypothetical protein
MGHIPTMPYTRTIPTVVASLLIPLFCLGQTPAPPPGPAPAAAPVPEGPTLAESRLDDATVKVRLMKQIAASIDQDVDMLNQKFKLEGSYYKDFTNGFKVRLELKLVGLGDTGSRMIQVGDGKVLWDLQEVLKTRIYRKKDIVPIMKKLDESNLDPFLKSLVIANLGFGGPEAMMSGLRKAVRFDQIDSDKLDGVDVWVIGGTWVDRSKLLGMNERQLPPTAPLPPYVPSSVRIFVGKENGWPYKIVMVGSKPSMIVEDARAIDPMSGRPVGVKKAPPKVDPTQITLLYKLLPTTEINPRLFFFDKPDNVPATSVKDETEEFMAQLDLLIQNDTANKKTAAAKAAEEPVFKTDPLKVGAPQSDSDSFPQTKPAPPK